MSAEIVVTDCDAQCWIDANHACVSTAGNFLRAGRAVEIIAAHRQAAEDRVARKAFAVLEDYIAAYPVDVFPQPPAGQHGQTVDACSAAALRAILPNVLRDLRLAFAGPAGGEGGDDASRS